ncbi:MAG: hypothetical protein ACXVHI_05125 [Frankiaceae bacterium]
MGRATIITALHDADLGETRFNTIFGLHSLPCCAVAPSANWRRSGAT